MTIRWGVRPSNGTEGDYQRGDTCDHCRKDHAWHLHHAVPNSEQPDGSCPIIEDGLVGEHSYPNPEGPPEWGQQERTGVFVCREYEPCTCVDALHPEHRARIEEVLRDARSTV